MPYYLAPLWDVHYAHIDRSSKGSKSSTNNAKHRIPRDLRIKLKHARAARGMLQDLEEEVRGFIRTYHERQVSAEKEEGMNADALDEDSEDEVVFVGRNGQMHDSPSGRGRFDPRPRTDGPDTEKMVLESPLDDRGAGFG